MKCPNCSASFHKTSKTKKFCTLKCANTFRARIRRGADHSPIKCLECSTVIKAKKSKQHKFCSKKCKDTHNLRRYGGTKYATAVTQKSRGKTLERYFKSLLHKKRARDTLSVDALLTMYKEQKGKCALSGVPMTHTLGQGRVTTNISIDRIKTGGDYSMDNVRLVCNIANVMRWTQTDEELLFMCQKISKKLKRANVSAKSNSCNSPSTSGN